VSSFRLAFLGFGNVGRALAQLLLRKRNELRERYDIAFSVTGIATGRHGMAIDPKGLDLNAALNMLHDGHSLDSLSAEPLPTDTLDFIRRCSADVLFENTPVNHATGQPALDYVRAALELGMHVATANKGTVVHGYHELTSLAKAKGKKYFFEATVMDGTPIFSLFRETLPAAQLLSFKGILNSTTNIILMRMEQGESFDDSVKYCQAIGIAETDPSADIDGWDAAIKVAALVTVLMDIPFNPQQVERTGIREITPDTVKSARAKGQRYKLICSAERSGASVKSSVAPQLVSPSSPMYAVDGSTSTIEFKTDILGDLSVSEKDPGPYNTAYGLLVDFINAVKG
jgi:homoserine dehydrogenase